MHVEITIFGAARKRILKTHSAVAVMEKVPVQVGGHNYVINGQL